MDSVWTAMNPRLLNQENLTLLNHHIMLFNLKAPQIDVIINFSLLIIVLLKDDNNYGWYGTFSQGKLSTFELPFVPGYPNNPSGSWSNGNFDNLTISLNATHPSN